MTDELLISKLLNRAIAGDVFGVDAAHDSRLFLIDDATAPVIDRRDHVVAIAATARNSSSIHPLHLPAPRFLREVFEEQRRHRAFEADMHFVDEPVGQRLEAHAHEVQALVAWPAGCRGER